MSKKPANSVLFIATLGVYIGLLMAGSAPAVVAQQAAAMTRNFELSDEIEKKDDLDNKPDHSDEELDKAIEAYAKSVENFVRNLQKLHLIDKFDAEWDTFDSYRNSFSPCPETGTGQSREFSLDMDPWLVPVIPEAKTVSQSFTCLADCLPFDGFVNRNQAKSSGVKLKYDRSDLTHELSISLSSGTRAGGLYAGLESAFKRFEVEEDEEYELNKVLEKHTSLTFTGNQVFIITRLPRAALDELLAKEA